MRFADILKMCFDSLSRRKGRTILTVLGVFIGCTSIIVMVSIGAGMQESYDQMLKNMGDLSIIEVYRGYNQNTGTQTESKLALSWWTGGIPKTATRWSWASILPITSPIR